MNDEVVRVACPSCGRRRKVRARPAGRPARCRCGHTLRVPAAGGHGSGGWRRPWVGAAAVLLAAGAGAGFGAWAVRAPHEPVPVAEAVAAEPGPVAPAGPAVPPPPEPAGAAAPPAVPDDPGPVAGADPPVAAPRPDPIPVPDPGPPPPDPKAVLDEVKRAVVVVRGKQGHGSGFLVRPDVVVTNSHVLTCELIEDVSVQFVAAGVPAEKGVGVRLLYDDPARDLALLWLDRPRAEPPLRLADSFDPAGRPRVFVVGSPGQEGPRALVNVVEPARCSEEVAVIRGRAFYRLSYDAGAGDVRIGPGNSGGPAVGAAGEVVGVLTRGDAADGRAYCVPAAAVRAAVDRLGDPGGWDRTADLATALHARDLAALCAYVKAAVAADVVEARYLVKEQLKLPVRPSTDGSRRVAGPSDRQLLDAYQRVHDRFHEPGVRAVRVVTASRDLTDDHKRYMNALRNELAEFGRLALLPVVPDRGVGWVRWNKHRCDKLLDLYCRNRGTGGDGFRSMVDDILARNRVVFVVDD